MNWALAIAALLTGFGAVLHPALTRRVLGPLIASDLPHATRWIARLCWDAVTLLFVVLTATFAAGAAGLVARDAVRLGGVLAAGIALLAAWSAWRAGRAPWRMPPVTVIGAAALLALFGS